MRDGEMADGKADYVFIALLMLLTLGAFVSGLAAGREDERKDALMAGVARYEADPKTGEARFVYRVTGTSPGGEQ
jgi:hypothetical protein